PRDSVLILLGHTEILSITTAPRLLPGGLNGYVRAGGAILVASDQAMTPVVERELRNVAGVRVTGHSLRCEASGPDIRYRGLDYCPLLQPVPDAPVKLFEGPITGVRVAPPLRVATNLPSTLETLEKTFHKFPGQVHVLAEIPAQCRFEVGNTPWKYSEKLP